VGDPLLGDCTKQSEAEFVALTFDAVERRAEPVTAARRRNAATMWRRELDIYSTHLTILMRPAARGDGPRP